MTDSRVIYGARCMWWDTIDKASSSASGLPVTPCCGSPMFECESEEVWWRDVDDYESRGGPAHYREFIEWLRGRCYPTMDIARRAFDAQRGKQ